jgi:hypothetical protein
MALGARHSPAKRDRHRPTVSAATTLRSGHYPGDRVMTGLPEILAELPTLTLVQLRTR